MYRICHVTCVHPPEDGRIFRRACVSTSLSGYETFLVERGNTYDKFGIHIIGIGEPDKPGRLYRMTTFAKKAYKTALDLDADLYHLHDPELLRFAKRFKKHGKKVVFDSHENYSEIILGKNYFPCYKYIGKQIYSYIERRYEKIDGITYPSEGTYFDRLKHLCKRACTTGNYPWRSELYDKYNEFDVKEEKTACFIGSLSVNRGITEIIKACYKAQFKLYLAGPFYSDDFKNQVFSMPEFSCVDYLGVIDRESVLQILRKTEIGLCVLHNIGQYNSSQTLSTKVYECMAMGMPVVLNDSPYNVEITNKLQFGICVDPLDVDAISNAIIKISNDKELKKKLRENGRKASRELFCWDQEQKHLISMYKEILGD